MINREYIEKANIFKALSDSNRLQIIDMLKSGELCACKILEKFHITQPTLSHHMKVLCDLGLVNSYKDANWMRYRLNKEKFAELEEFIKYLTNNT